MHHCWLLVIISPFPDPPFPFPSVIWQVTEAVEFSPQQAGLSGRTLWYAAACCGSSLSGEGYDGWGLRHWCFYVPFPSSRWDRDVVGRAPHSSPGGAAQWPRWGPALPTLTGWWSLEKEKQIAVAKKNIPCFPKHKHWTSFVTERNEVSCPHPHMPRATPRRGRTHREAGKSLFTVLSLWLPTLHNPQQVASTSLSSTFHKGLCHNTCRRVPAFESTQYCFWRTRIPHMDVKSHTILCSPSIPFLSSLYCLQQNQGGSNSSLKRE